MTAFLTDKGHYQFSYMPFGTKTTRAIFTKLMRTVLSSILHVAYYYDDGVVESQTWEQVFWVLGEVFTRIRQAGLTVKPANRQVGMQEVSFLGHLIRSGEKNAIAKTVQRFLDAARTSTKRQVRSWGSQGIKKSWYQTTPTSPFPFLI